MRIIDVDTGLPPVLRNGDSFSVESTLIDGVDADVPDGVDDEGREVKYVRVVHP